MHTREELQSKLEELLGVKHVYYQPPDNLKMEYPAIRYSKSEIQNLYANNIKYISHNVYDLVVISKKPDNPVIKKILELPYSEFDRHYVVDGLNHDIIRIFF
jgi:hypothetical protein